MERSKWVDRKFRFDAPPGWLPNIIERLLGTPVRLHALVADVNEVLAARAQPGQWSIKEHIGHLTDLEDLHRGRIDDLLQNLPSLRAADMTNTRTMQANHNNRSLQRLINDFSQQRRLLVDKLASLDDAVHERSAMHPRLRTKMRAVDVAFFTAEHDDHHLASIREITRGFRK